VVLPVSARAARHLGQLRAGDVIGVGFAGGGVVSASAVPAVNTIAALPANTPLGSFVLPPVTGRFVRFDAGTNMVTVQTPGGQRSFPVTGTAAQGLSGLSPGDNLSLDFRVTQEFNQTRANASLARGAATPTSTVTQAAGTGASAPVLAVNNVQAATGQTPIQSAIGGPGASRVAPNTASINAPGLSAATGATGPTAVGGTGLAAATGTAGGAGTGTPAAPGLATPGTFSQMTGPFTGIAIPNAVPGSPFANPVPSLPGPTPMLNVVLPPAIAKAPMSNEEVGLMRGQGERDLDSAAMVLAMQANEIDALWFRYKNACLGGFTSETTQAGREWFLLLEGRVRTPNDDGCRALFNQLQGMALGFREQMDIALEAARRADVLPGIVRQILERHRIER
jgi:hypothetical protein